MDGFDDILKDIETFVLSNPKTKSDPNYMEMKNGHLPLKAGFSSIP